MFEKFVEFEIKCQILKKKFTISEKFVKLQTKKSLRKFKIIKKKFRKILNSKKLFELKKIDQFK
jgi:hypothetical protein